MFDTSRKLLTTKEAASICGLTEVYMRKLRMSGEGPEFYKVRRKVLYDPTRLQAWLASRLRTKTCEVQSAS